MDEPLGPGSVIAGFAIRSALGEGGMGVVYLAERPQGGPCALKVLSARAESDPSFATRFKREAQYAASLEHPHILDLYEAGEAPDGTLFFAMQYVDGPDLRVLLARDGVLSLATAVTILGQIGDALDCAHAKGLIHRDVKPGNIIVAEESGAEPHAYLTDFGLSKNPSEDSIPLTKQGQFIGTTAYTAPEEILAHPRNHLLDVYSLGCVMYEALAGSPPFVRDRDLDVLYAHISDPRPAATAVRPDLPPGIDAVIARAMAVATEDRYPSCGEFIAAARALVGEDAAAAAAAPAALRLAVTAGPATGRELSVEDELVLGRLTTFDGALADDRQISRRHSRVHRAAGGGFVVEDEGSANGTFVNGVRIERARSLAPGDELRIGSTAFVVHETTAEAAGPATEHIAIDGDTWRAETP